MEDTQEDIVSYRIFPDFDGNVTDVKARLESLRAQCLAITYAAASEYIWQHETFSLRVCSSPSDCHFPSLQGSKAVVELENDIAGVEFSTPESFVSHLSGKVRFGDNLEDEWLVVFLLLEISRRIPDVSITVRDTDGEFLLIEAAYFIPHWIKHENSQNRVFIRQGHVHLVPFTPATPLTAEGGQALSAKQALQVLSNGGVNTRASKKVMDAILNRMKQYPEKALENVHRARCRVPLPVAQILKYEPQMISLAVEAFYNRDYDAMKAVSKMEKFVPKSQDGTVEMVDVIVRMSRAMYAQLLQQVFEATRCYPMPSNLTGSRLKEAELGMKVACGFEIMYWERSAYDSETNSVEEDGDPESNSYSSQPWSAKKSEVIPSNDPGWQTFKASLEKNGYFRDLLEGSKGYRELIQTAVMQYRSSNMFASASVAMRAPVRRTDELLSLPYGASDFAGAGCEEADSDDWMYNGEEELSAVMKERQKELDDYEVKLARRKAENKREKEGSNQGGESGDFQVEEVVRSMQSFVNKMSSFEGAELPGNNDDMEDNDDESVSVDMSTLLKELGTVFSPEDIASMLSTQAVPEDSDMSSDTDLDADEEDSDYEGEATATTTGTSKAHRIEIEDEDPRALGNQEDSMFIEAYSNALVSELQRSTMAKSFLRKEDVKDIARGKDTVTSDKILEASGKPGQAEPEPADKMAEEPEPDDDENDLVDVDANLVESLLRSYMFQQGMPGPATNLLGAMNIDLPENADKRPGPSTRPNK